MYHPTRGGVRGGRDQFNWEDIKGDKHRENYLGHSIKAPVGRWQKGKDLHWYAKDRHSDEAAALEEIKRLKEEEDDAMQEMLGLAPKKNRRLGNQLDAREMSEVLQKVKDGVEADPSYAAGERVQGLGFAGQETPRQLGSGQTGVDKSGNVTFERIAPVINEQKNQEPSGDEGNRDATKDGLGARRLEGEDKTSSSSPEEEGISSRKRKREKRREEKRHKHKRKTSKARESEQEELSDSYHGDGSDGTRKVRYASQEVETSRDHTERKAFRHKDQSRNYYLSAERRNDIVTARHDRDSLEETSRATSRRDYRSHQSRNGKARHDSDSEDIQRNVQETIRTPKGVYRSHHSRSSKLRHDSDSEESQGRLQDTVRISRQDYISQHSRNGKKRHDSDGEDSQGMFPEADKRTSVLSNSQSKRDSRSYYSTNNRVRHDSESENEGSQEKLKETVRDSRIGHRSQNSRNSNVRHDSDGEGSQGRLQEIVRTSRRDHRSQNSRGGNLRHDGDSEGSQGKLQQSVRTTRRDYRSRHSNDGNVKYDSDRDDSQGRLQETVRAPRRDYRSLDSRDGNGRHNRDKETEGRRDHERQRSFSTDKKHSRRRHDSD